MKTSGDLSDSAVRGSCLTLARRLTIRIRPSCGAGCARVRRLALVCWNRSLSSSGFARLVGCLPALVRVESAQCGVEPLVSGATPLARLAVAVLEEVGTIGGRGVTVATGVGPVDGRLTVSLLRVACLRRAVASFRLLIAPVSVVDQPAHPLVTGIGSGVPSVGGRISLIGEAVPAVGGKVARIGEGVAFIGHARPLVVSGKTFFHGHQAYGRPRGLSGKRAQRERARILEEWTT